MEEDMATTTCSHKDCGALIVIPDEQLPQEPGKYEYECPVCQRGATYIGVVTQFYQKDD